MAIYHCSTKPLSRSTGRSAVAAAAYRSGEKLEDKRTGLVHDYTNRSGVMQSYTLLPSGESCDRNELWNKAEEAEKRKDARTAREWIVAIPSEIVPKEGADRKFFTGSPDYELVKDFAEHLSQTYGTAVDVAIHSPDKKGDNRNYHAHILTTTRKVEFQNGELAFGDKASIELSDKKRSELKLGKAKETVKQVRETWANLANRKLEEQNKETRINHRSLKDQGIDRIPQIHVGVTASNMERKGKASERGNQNSEIKKLNAEIIHLEGVRSRQKEVERMQNALQEEKRKQEIEKKKSVSTQVEAPTPKPDKENVDAEIVFKKILRQTYKDVNNHFERLKAEKEKTDAVWSAHFRKEPQEPTGLFSRFKRKQFEKEHKAWAAEEKRLRSDRISANMRWEDRHRDKRPEWIADDLFKKQHPELHAERERLKKLEQERLDKERQTKRKEREVARKRNRRRDRGLGR